MFSGAEVTLILVLLLLVPAIFYLITLQKTLEAISPENRSIPPGQVWLLLIPLFNLVWQFIAVERISNSIKAECIKLNIPIGEDRPTYNIGLTKNILSFGGIIPFLGILLNIAFLVYWIIYWVKVNEYKNLIIANKDNYLLDAEQGIFHSNNRQ